MAHPIELDDLLIHVLNVGFGDNILIEFPADDTGKRSYAVVDCEDYKKTTKYLDKLMSNPPERSRLEFVCATHPHYDHIRGIKNLLKHNDYKPLELWDCGFRHNSQTYRGILETLMNQDIELMRVSSGMERYYGRVRVTVLSPSVSLRNRYATYGVDMNNASVVLRLEHHSEDVLLARSAEYTGSVSIEAERQAGRSVVILAGDAEFDSWAQIVQEYPQVERTSAHDPLVKKMVNYLSCAVVKIAHHGSMHSAPLDVYEKMDPTVAIVSTKQKKSSKKVAGRVLTRNLFPHQTSTIALEECGTRILTTDGSYESQEVEGGGETDPSITRAGSIVVVVPPGKKPRWKKLDDGVDDVPDPPTEV
jgi:beta-lactamase superfamily II metal-dependent hydrolase